METFAGFVVMALGGLFSLGMLYQRIKDGHRKIDQHTTEFHTFKEDIYKLHAEDLREFRAELASTRTEMRGEMVGLNTKVDEINTFLRNAALDSARAAKKVS